MFLSAPSRVGGFFLPFHPRFNVTRLSPAGSYIRRMSLKSLLSEITTGIWMMETPNVSAYKEIIAGLRSGSFQKEEAQMFHQVMGDVAMNPQNKQPELINKVAVIDFEGELTKYTGMCNIGADTLIAKTLEYNRDPSVKAFIFRMDGPGGNAAVIPMFYELKEKLTKPVIAFVEKACSLHYYAAAILAEHIMMANDFTAEVGSIGAMIMFEKPDKELIMIRPPQSSDKNQELIEALEGNYELLEKRLIPLAERFMADVKAARPQVKDEVLHGKVVYAKDAIKMGLADSIGNIEMAYKLAIARAELNNKTK